MVLDGNEGTVLCRAVDSVLQVEFASNFCSLPGHFFHFVWGAFFVFFRNGVNHFLVVVGGAHFVEVVCFVGFDDDVFCLPYFLEVFFHLRLESVVPGFVFNVVDEVVDVVFEFSCFFHGGRIVRGFEPVCLFHFTLAAWVEKEKHCPPAVAQEFFRFSDECLLVLELGWDGDVVEGVGDVYCVHLEGLRAQRAQPIAGSLGVFKFVHFDLECSMLLAGKQS